MSPIEEFLHSLVESLRGNSFVKCVLSKHRGPEPDLERVSLRRLVLKEEDCIAFVYRYKTRDITKNASVLQTLQTVRELLTGSFAHAHLLTATEEIQLKANKKGVWSLHRAKAAEAVPVDPSHDRDKHRLVDIARPFLVALGVTDAQGRLIPSMSRKWKQINKFIEIFDHALKSSGLDQAKTVRVADFGAGKGYLTFAVHDYLRSAGLAPQVRGVELREELVRFCNEAIARLGLSGLRFDQGDVNSEATGDLDIMIALHACDTATDHAIYKGIRAGASIIMCSPCCHKEIRPQMHSPAPLQALLQHGIHLGQEAEMVTDTLRALLLEANGYSAQVFEFVSLEHTSKNKMILAVKHAASDRRAEAQAQVEQIKAFYGIRQHCLESLLKEAS